MATIDEHPRIAPGRARAALIRVGVARWRVTSTSGRVAGLVEAVTTIGGDRYLARRFHWPSRSFRSIGEFWSLDDAAESLLAG